MLETIVETGFKIGFFMSWSGGLCLIGTVLVPAFRDFGFINAHSAQERSKKLNDAFRQLGTGRVGRVGQFLFGAGIVVLIVCAAIGVILKN